jgi:hypothetical protein
MAFWGILSMHTGTPPLNLLMDLESRQEELLVQLDELDNRIEKTLAECQVYRRPVNPSSSSDPGAPIC